MKWLPRRFNDSFALWLYTSLLAFDVWLLGFSGVAKELITFVLGAQFGWLGQVVTFYYRKAQGENGEAVAK